MPQGHKKLFAQTPSNNPDNPDQKLEKVLSKVKTLTEALKPTFQDSNLSPLGYKLLGVRYPFQPSAPPPAALVYDYKDKDYKDKARKHNRYDGTPREEAFAPTPPPSYSH